MTLYRYKAADCAGEVLEGEIQAGSQEAVIRELHTRGHVPIRIEEMATLASSRSEMPMLLRPRGVVARDIEELSLELATLLEAGVPLHKALDILSRLTDKPAKRDLVSKLHADVRGGKTLSDALDRHTRVFSPFYRNMVRAGEATGNLHVALVRLTDCLERSRELRDALMSALLYPTILLSVGLLSIAIILGFVVPRISKMFEQAEQALPWFTEIIVSAGAFVQHYGWTLAITAVAALAYAHRRLRVPAIRLRFDRWLLGIPLISEIITKLDAARFTHTLGTLLGGGVVMLDALAIAKEVVTNRTIARSISRVTERVRQGEGLARPIQEAEVFPSLVGQLLQVGEETGNLEKMLLRLGQIHERDVQTTLRRLMTVLEPAFILVFAVIIAAIILSIVVAIFSINDLAF